MIYAPDLETCDYLLWLSSSISKQKQPPYTLTQQKQLLIQTRAGLQAAPGHRDDCRHGALVFREPADHLLDIRAPEPVLP